MNRNYVYRNIKKMSRDDIVAAIAEKLNSITFGKKDRPVILKKIMVSMPEKKKYGWTNYYYLHNIFFGNDNRLYGDLISISRNDPRDLFFGKEIESFGNDVLADILNTLEKERWSLEEDAPESLISGPSLEGDNFYPKRKKRALTVSAFDSK